MMNKYFSFLSVVLLTSVSAFASGDHSAPDDPNRFGVGKAVEAADHDQGFKLSAKAEKNLGVTFQKVTGAGPWKIPKQSLVHLKQSEAVYRRYDGWISMVLVKVVSQRGDTVTIKSADLEPDDEVAVTGVTFLRMTDSDINAGTVDTCAH